MELTDIIINITQGSQDIDLLVSTSQSAGKKVISLKTLTGPDISPYTAQEKNLNCIIFTDNKAGVTFAEKYSIPYIGILNTFDFSTTSRLYPNAVCLTTTLEDITYRYALEQWSRAHNLPITIVETTRFTIREMTTVDIGQLHHIYSNESITKYIPPIAPTVWEEQQKHESYIKYVYQFYGFGLWGVFLPNGTLIGRVGIEATEFEGANRIELSYLIDPLYQNQGYASACIYEVYKYCIEELEIHSLSAFIATNNLNSIKTARKMGMNKVKECDYKDFSCYLYEIKDIKNFLPIYEEEQKRVEAAKIAWNRAQDKPVQSVYKKIYRRIRK